MTEPAHILIVDDQRYIRELLSTQLAEEGYRVSGVEDIESIWKHFGDSRPDLVLLDLFLDGFEGWEALRDIKKRHPKLPVLIVTAYDSFSEDPRLRQADGYVIKSLAGFDGLKEKVVDLIHMPCV